MSSFFACICGAPPPPPPPPSPPPLPFPAASKSSWTSEAPTSAASFSSALVASPLKLNLQESLALAGYASLRRNDECETARDADLDDDRDDRGEDGAATRLANAEAFSNQRGIAAAAAEAFRAAVSRSLTTHGYPQWHDIPCDTVSHGGTVQGVVHPLPCGMPQRHGISQRHGIP